MLAGLAVVVDRRRPLRLRQQLQQGRRQQHLRPGLAGRGAGVWPAANYRLDAAGGAQLPGLAGAIAALALLAGVAWWVRRRELTVPVALGACALLYLVSLPFSGDYSQAKALMIAAPLAMLVAIRPLLAEFPGGNAESAAPGWARAGWAALAVVFIGGAVYSSFLALRDAPVGPPGHGARAARLPAGASGASRSSTRGRTATPPTSCSAPTPTCRWSSSPTPTSRPTRRSRSTPATPTARSTSTPSRTALWNASSYVITGRAAWNSAAPPNFRRVATTPSYVLWERTGPTPEDRHVLLEGTEAGRLSRLRRAGDPHPARQPGPGLALPRRRGRAESSLGRGQRPRHRRARPRRRWSCRPAPGTSRSSTSPPSTSPSRRPASSSRCRRPSTASGRTRSASATTASSGPPGATAATAAAPSSP